MEAAFLMEVPLHLLKNDNFGDGSGDFSDGNK